LALPAAGRFVKTYLIPERRVTFSIFSGTLLAKSGLRLYIRKE
jgi:hypothetical protein